MSLVLDSSVTLAWYFEDEVTDRTEAIFADVRERGAIVPTLWRYEVANGLQTAVRGKRIDASYRDDSLMDLEALDIAVDPGSDALAWSASVRLAERHGLTVYDAAYLELAQRRRLPLATLDRALGKAAALELVSVLGIGRDA